ncbi:MAG: alpha/beta hydrolase [Candidatus Dormibacteraeota bacterium]|nr:alpha/beta hydrolase [Candidatus Dormibacteraeota bacterium]
MASATLNGVDLFYEEVGKGQPLVLVHGSWADHTTWGMVVPDLSKHFRVISYDRRGHSRSSVPPGQGHVEQDVDDLAALIQHLDAAPANVAGNSFGGSITLRLAAAHPDLCRSISAHEPPLLRLLERDPRFGPGLVEVQTRIRNVIEVLQRREDAKAAELFVETVALGPGMWTLLPEPVREVFISNAGSWLDECQDPEALLIDLGALHDYGGPAQLTGGDQSPPFFGAVLELVKEALPQADRFTYHGSGHVPQETHPGQYASQLASFLQRVEMARV